MSCSGDSGIAVTCSSESRCNFSDSAQKLPVTTTVHFADAKGVRVQKPIKRYKPPNYIILSTIILITNPPLGIIALYYAIMSNRMLKAKKIRTATKYSTVSLGFCIAAAVSSVIIAVHVVLLIHWKLNANSNGPGKNINLQTIQDENPVAEVNSSDTSWLSGIINIKFHNYKRKPFSNKTIIRTISDNSHLTNPTPFMIRFPKNTSDEKLNHSWHLNNNDTSHRERHIGQINGEKLWEFLS